MHDPENHKYDDMFFLPHHVSETRPQMPLLKRAAQFAPFAALSGYEEAIKEASEIASKAPEPSKKS